MSHRTSLAQTGTPGHLIDTAAIATGSFALADNEISQKGGPVDFELIITQQSTTPPNNTTTPEPLHPAPPGNRNDRPRQRRPSTHSPGAHAPYGLKFD